MKFARMGLSLFSLNLALPQPMHHHKHSTCTCYALDEGLYLWIVHIFHLCDHYTDSHVCIIQTVMFVTTAAINSRPPESRMQA